MINQCAHRVPAIRQSGSTLLIALAILATVTIITLGATRSSLMELRMVNNSQAKNEANQYAQSAADWLINEALISAATSTPKLNPTSPIGTEYIFEVPTDVVSGSGTTTLIATKEACPPLPVTGAGVGVGYCYRIESRYQGQGSATVIMGIRLL